MTDRLKVTLVLDPDDADLIAWALDEQYLRGGGTIVRTTRLGELRDQVRSARRHRHGRRGR